MSPEEKEDKELWKLLGRLKAPPVSSFFSRNVLRAVRAEEPRTLPTVVKWLGSLRRSWRVALLSAVAGLVIGASVPSLMNKVILDRSLRLITQHTIGEADLDAIEHLDELLAYEENSLWLDDSIR